MEYTQTYTTTSILLPFLQYYSWSSLHYQQLSSDIYDGSLGIHTFMIPTVGNQWWVTRSFSPTQKQKRYIPSYHSLGYQSFKKELVYWPVIHPPTKRFFTYAESRVWNHFRMGWQFVSRTIPCNCAIWMHRCCKMSIGFISLPY